MNIRNRIMINQQRQRRVHKKHLRQRLMEKRNKNKPKKANNKNQQMENKILQENKMNKNRLNRRDNSKSKQVRSSNSKQIIYHGIKNAESNMKKKQMLSIKLWGKKFQLLIKHYHTLKMYGVKHSQMIRILWDLSLRKDENLHN